MYLLRNDQIFSFILNRLSLCLPLFTMSVTLSRPKTFSCRALGLTSESCLHCMQKYLTVISPASAGHISRNRHFLQSVLPQPSQLTTAMYLPQSSHNLSGIFSILISFFMGVNFSRTHSMRMACHEHVAIHLYVFTSFILYAWVPDRLAFPFFELVHKP